ncbi:peptidoglycan recognition protein family protein [Metabacillus sp. Hm71]|uniref:peptidoglycan recognition protein family protein n=1 Tax=Metabacillus sp. Hm71 TaxID=3450743 RepID=UPI003F42803B
MTIEVKQNLVSSSKYSIKCPYSMDAEYITYHNTANDASAENEVKYMNSNNNSVSYHFAVDDKEVIQAVPTNRIAWHCGDGGKGKGNRKSIGVEVCYSRSGGERFKKAEALAHKFIAQLLHERGWGTDRVKQHNFWSGKNCPHRVRAEGRWNEVIAEIQAELNKLKGTNTPVKPTPSVTKGYLEKGDKGAAVKELQTLLEKAGFEVGAIDGIFGNATDKAVRAFQAKYKLSVDGLAGNATMQVLETVTAPKPVVKPVSPTPSPKKEESVQILTGGLIPANVEIISKYFKDKGWWAEIQFRTDGENPRALSGGLKGKALEEYKAWLDERGWYYEIVKK